MNIQVEIIKEHKDGSADALVHFDKEGLEILVQQGILSILLQYIKQEKKGKK
jgi:phosphomannomutase